MTLILIYHLFHLDTRTILNRFLFSYLQLKVLIPPDRFELFRKDRFNFQGDYLIPDLEPSEAPRIGKYGTMRHNYLRDYHRGVFDGMLLTGKLNAHLEEVDRQASEMMERLTTQMAKAEGVTEQFKAADQMAWVGAMNNMR